MFDEPKVEGRSALRPIWAVAFLAGALILSGCGSDDPGESEPTTANREASASTKGSCPASKNSVERELIYDNYLDLPIIIGSYPESIDCYDWGSRTPASYGNMELGPGERRIITVDDNNTTRKKAWNTAARVTLSPGVGGGLTVLRLSLSYWQAASSLSYGLYGGTDSSGGSGTTKWCTSVAGRNSCVLPLDLHPEALRKTGGPIQARVAGSTLAIERRP